MLFYQTCCCWAMDTLMSPPECFRLAVQMLCISCCSSRSLALLPIHPSAAWKPTAADDPCHAHPWTSADNGRPAVLPVSSDKSFGPIVVHAHSARHALSAVRAIERGILISLLAYPVAIEPVLSSRNQLLSWSVGYAAFVVLCAIAALQTRSAICRNSSFCSRPPRLDVARPRGVSIGALAVVCKSPQSGRGCCAVPMDSASQPLSTQFRLVLRSRRLVSAATLSMAAAAGVALGNSRRITARLFEPPGIAGAFLPGAADPLHLLPRRTRAASAGSVRVNGLFPDHRGRRRARRYLRRTYRAKDFHEYLELPIGLLGSMMLGPVAAISVPDQACVACRGRNRCRGCRRYSAARRLDSASSKGTKLLWNAAGE